MLLKERIVRVKVTQESYAILLKELIARPSNSHELTELTGLHLKTVQDLMRIFKKHRLVHIHAWDPDARGADHFEVWAWGPGRDAKRRKKSAADRQRTSRANKKLREMLNMTAGVAPT